MLGIVARLARLAGARRVAFDDAGHGYDAFGFNPDALALGMQIAAPIYDWYFRVESDGIERVPKTGACILASNHSGLLPIDAAMIIVDVVRRTDCARVPRAIGDLFIPFLPWVGTAMNRMGMVSGTSANVRRLLERGEILLVFPEGTRGIGKGFRKRYQLQAWRVGHVELAIRHRAPVVPVAVIGAEEAWPQVGRLDGVHPFGAPFLPIPLTPIPLPVKFHIRYGEPIALHDRWSPESADDPKVVREAARIVSDAVKALIETGLRRRGQVST